MLRLIVLAWLFLSTGAFAQVVTVRSGEHDGFTRLVLTFPEPAGWDFGRTGDGYGFRTRQPRWRYDISTVFSLIPRDRLAALWVDPDSGVLRLGLACPCHAIATPFRPGIVVVDIRPGPPPPGSPFEQALDNAGRDMPHLTQRTALRPRERPRDFRPLPAPALPAWHLAADKGADPSLVPNLALDPDPRAAVLKERLLRELSRGIAAGSLSPMATIPATPPPTAKPPEVDVGQPPPGGTQLRILPHDATALAGLSDTGRACVPDDQLDIPAWGADAPPADQIARMRAGLSGEFDRADTSRILQLARLYVHLGFGAETRSLLAAWNLDGADHSLLDTLGVLVDGGLAERGFDGMASCNGRAALWAVLASPHLPHKDATNTAAVLRAFSELPLGLRRALGVSLADRFLAAGDPATARRIRDAISRATDREGGPVGLIDAGLDRQSGAAVQAEAKLIQVARHDTTLAPRARADLIDSRIRRGETPDSDTIAELEALMREQRGSADEPALRRALAQSLVLTGNARRAFSELAGEEPSLAAPLWSLLAERGDDMDFVEQALTAGDSAQRLPPPVRQSIARRLIANGFPDATGNWLSGLPGPSAALLRAEAALAMRDGRGALRELAGLSDADSNRLRARAFELVGNLDEAQQAWEDAGDSAQAARVRFLARHWRDLDPSDDSTIAELLSAALAPAPEQVAAIGLADGQSFLDASRATRQAADGLLRDMPVP